MTSSSTTPLLITAPMALMSMILAGCAVTNLSQSRIPEPDREADRAELLRLNAEVTHSLIVGRDAALFSRLALDEFRVLGPGGLIENKERAIAGVTSWDAVSVDTSGEEVVFHGPVALVMGRMDIDGEMRPVGRWGPLKFTSVWVREGGEWRLLSRSLTPCIDRLVEMGRC